jgi:radical SAM protein (TIGR01212 family)
MQPRHYNKYSLYLTKKFGAPVARIPINAGFSCPNRDGTKSLDGCSFCDNRSFSPVAKTVVSPLEHLTASMARLKSRYTRFIAYLQPFSNTYGSVAQLRSVYEPLVSVPGVVGLSVGTRPDCLGPEIVDYLGDLASRTFVSVEIGLQSSHDATLSLVNRGHSYDDFVRAVTRVAAQGIDVVAHIILGLPGENADMMFETASRLAALPVTGVKIHQLMIIKGTEMEKMVGEGKAETLQLSGYARLLCGFLERLRPDQHIHRIMADSSEKNGLIAPLWSVDKNDSLRYLQKFMEEHGIVQGSGYKNVAIAV